jgi:hypothetical protein
MPSEKRSQSGWTIFGRWALVRDTVDGTGGKLAGAGLKLVVAGFPVVMGRPNEGRIGSPALVAIGCLC